MLPRGDLRSCQRRRPACVAKYLAVSNCLDLMISIVCEESNQRMIMFGAAMRVVSHPPHLQHADRVLVDDERFGSRIALDALSDCL